MVLEANPLLVYIDLMRDALIESSPPTASAAATLWLLGVGWALVVGVGGFVYFWRGETGVRPWLSRPDGRRATAGERIPTVVVDDVHVVYRVYGAGTPAAARPSPPSAASLTGKRSPAIREVHAVKGVSFTAYRGEAIGLIGSNGSGKSTLLRAIAGLLPADRGAVYTDGPALAARRERGADERPVRRAQRHARLPGDGHDAGRRSREATPAIIDFSGINDRGDFISLPMRTYSSGMAARLRFAIAAAKNHDVLLIDEALATGDAQFRRRSEERIRELRAEAGTVFLVSHAIGTIRDTCERTIWLESGVIRMDGPTEVVVPEYEKYMNRKRVEPMRPTFRAPQRRRRGGRRRSAPAPRSGTSPTSARPRGVGAGCVIGRNVYVDADVVGRRPREDPEQRLGLPGRDDRGRGLRRPVRRVHQRPAARGRRTRTGRSPPRWCAGARRSAPTPPSCAASRSASTR